MNWNILGSGLDFESRNFQEFPLIEVQRPRLWWQYSGWRDAWCFECLYVGCFWQWGRGTSQLCAHHWHKCTMAWTASWSCVPHFYLAGHLDSAIFSHSLFAHVLCTACLRLVKEKTMMHGGEADEWNGNPEMHYFGMVGFDCGFNYVAFSAGTVSQCLMTSHDVLIPLFDAFHPRRHHHMELPNW